MDALKTDTMEIGYDRFSKIIVPANAFVYADGRLVTTPVKIGIVRYKNPADMISDGIPMTYGGKPLESRSMFRIEGWANGEPVRLAEGKQLRVELEEYEDDSLKTGYNFYQFDPQPPPQPPLGRWETTAPAALTTNFSPP